MDSSRPLKTFKIVVFPLSLQPRYKNFISCCKQLPFAQHLPSADKQVLEVSTEFEHGGETWKLCFTIYSGRGSDHLPDPEKRAYRLYSSSADCLIGLHSPVEEAHLYPYTDHCAKNMFGEFEAIYSFCCSSPSSYNDKPQPVFLLTLSDFEEHGRKAMEFPKLDAYITTPSEFKPEHLRHLLQMVFLRVVDGSSDEQNYFDFSKTPPPLGGVFGDMLHCVSTPPKLLRVLFVGVKGVGKRATIAQFSQNRFLDDCSSISGVVKKNWSLCGGGEVVFSDVILYS